MSASLIFVKLGGSLITDKRQRATPDVEAICQLAEALVETCRVEPALRVLLGHGSGSFGHWEADRYGTRRGVETGEQWEGFAQVSAAASRLNRIVVDAFLDAGVPVVSLQPSASALTNAGQLVHLAEEPIRRALDAHLVPLIFGDVAFDRVLGGTILSTEDLFVYLAERMQPERILLLGNAPGVLDSDHQVIPSITPQNYAQAEVHLRGAHCTDVTGGMADKVRRMVGLVQHLPALRVSIMTGREPGNLRLGLLNPEAAPGTSIYNEDATPDA